MLGPGTHLAFQHDHHKVRVIAFAHDDFAWGGAAFLGLRNKPEKIFVRQVREDGNGAQLGDKFFCGGWRGVFGHARPVLLTGRLIVPWPDIGA